MQSLASLDPMRSTFLNIQRTGQHHDPKRHPAHRRSRKLKEADEEAASHSIFVHFAELPLELQRRIWHFAALAPRIVEVHEVQLHSWILEAWNCCTGKVSLPERSAIAHLRSNTDDPPLLRTCFESRDVAMRKYKRVDLANEYCADSVFFEFNCDTMYLSRQTLESSALGAWSMLGPEPPGTTSNRPRLFLLSTAPQGQALRRSLRSIAFDANVLLRLALNSRPGCNWTAPHPQACRLLAMFLNDFQALEEVTLVFNDERTIIDGNLSSIYLHQLTLGSDIAALLEETANLLSIELKRNTREREAQAERVAQNVLRNFGGSGFPATVPDNKRRTIPSVETRLTRLKPIQLHYRTL